MCPACLAVAAIVGSLFRPWARRRRERQAQGAAAWRPDSSRSTNVRKIVVQ
jgi:hypothetical protein